ncbi:hypothetical protein MOP88_16875 [Sphingomonas sp. WKB10]|nr:hypothetical protein [Sphingomonas sp. WKB10]
MKKGSAGTSVRDCSHPFCRVMRPASMRSTFGRVLVTPRPAKHSPFEHLGVLPLAQHDRRRSNCGRAAVLIDGLREQVESSDEITSVVLFRVP